jgi:hypothetical protein
LHGIHGQVLDTCLQHSGTHLRNCACSSKVCESNSWQKTDKKGAKWIADLFKHDLVAGSFIPPFDIRQFRDLTRYRIKVTNFNIGEKNRAQNCLTVSNIQLANVVSDVFGKSATAITKHLFTIQKTRILTTSHC